MFHGMLAAAFGAATGTLLALMMGRFWLFGAILGGVVGYLTYDIQSVIEATRTRMAHVYRSDTLQAARLLLWCVLAMTSLGQSFGILVSLARWQWSWLAIWGLTVVGFGIGITFGLLFVALSGERSAREDITQTFRCAAINLNIVVLVSYWAPVVSYRTLRVLINLLVVSFLFALIAVRATPHILRDVYSDRRLIAGLSALQGAIVGYFAHSWVLAAIVGGACFVAQIQLVHRRLVHQQGW
ncbi:MAG: hypothetical protein IT406_01190 [Candidatus Yanofskybacteria bacterium]|nr:hypothetical protein [Candidatus Yanofskybacteria bacterium]